MKQIGTFRYVLAVAGAGGVAVFFTGMYRSWFLLLASVVALFLGITDFGRQCPLFLSARHLLSRWRHGLKTPTRRA
jgi:hypothetical protein